MQFDLEIDKLTHSLEDAQTGEILLTEVLPLEKNIRSKSALWSVYGNCNTCINEISKRLFSRIF